MSDNPRDFIEDDGMVQCDSCEEWLDKDEAFYDPIERCYYHKECAEVWRCPYCGEWNDDALAACACGEKKP